MAQGQVGAMDTGSACHAVAMSCTTCKNTRNPTTVFAKYGLPRRRDQRAAVVVSDAIKALPNLQGWGELGSLHQAMARDAS